MEWKDAVVVVPVVWIGVVVFCCCNHVIQHVVWGEGAVGHPRGWLTGVRECHQDWCDVVVVSLRHDAVRLGCTA